MTRVNISMPEELFGQARSAGLNISQVAQRAVGAELDRLAKISALDAYLAELDAELGPVSDAAQVEASDWADRVLGQKSPRNRA